MRGRIDSRAMIVKAWGQAARRVPGRHGHACGHRRDRILFHVEHFGTIFVEKQANSTRI